MNSEISNFTYDQIYQLTQVVVNANTSESYTYDQVGNRLSSLGVSPYTYSSSNQMASTPGATYSYDNNGNTTSKTDATGTTTYEWDFENRLTRVTLPDQSTVTFKYDPFGRRIQKIAPQAITIHVYDGASILQEVDGSGGLLARYTQDLGVDEPLAMLRKGTTSYYHADGLNSISSLSDSAGLLAATYSYDSFGNPSVSMGALGNYFRYAAREFDPETDFYYYRARYYDQEVGRFLTEDPIGFSGGINFYPYVNNNPTNFIDPSGNQAQPLAPTAVGLCGFGPVACGVGIGVAVTVVALSNPAVQQALRELARDITDALDDAIPRDLPACRDDKDDYCQRRWEAEQQYCIQQFYGKNNRYLNQYMDRAFYRFRNCTQGRPDPGPLDPRDPRWSNY